MTTDRRAFGLGRLAGAATSFTPLSAFANANPVKIAPHFLPQRVRHNYTEPSGTISAGGQGKANPAQHHEASGKHTHEAEPEWMGCSAKSFCRSSSG